MGKIKQLPLHEAQKIAAGEVVERPTNVVKELIENSIDAGATHIQLYLEDAGQTLLRVIDNGSGMSPDDAVACFAHHATSKITSVHDLVTLTSFGFRGEALASISAASKVNLMTKEPTAQQGTKISRKDTINIIDDVSCAGGTDITIHDLFYNVPARKKFLKTVQTELRAITQVFESFCFDYPHLHFSLYSENKELYNYPPVKNLSERAYQLWSTNAHNLIALDAANDHVAITGFISNHQWYRYDRTQLFFFVNRRWIKNQNLAKALIKGYNNVIPPGQFPSALISLIIDPEQLDINIHPRKQEVEFLHPRTIEQLLQKAVKQALENNLSHYLKTPVTIQQEPQPYYVHHQPRITPSPDSIFAMPQPALYEPLEKSWQAQPKSMHLPEEKNSECVAIKTESPMQLLGQYKTTYLLVEHEDGLCIIDQHAAHERILYEQFRQRFGSIATVTLLFPQIIKLAASEYATIIPHLEVIGKHGIQIEPFGTDQLIVQATPVHLQQSSLHEIIHEIIKLIAEYRTLPEDEFFKTMHEKLHAQMACKAAVKAGDKLSTEQMLQILHDLNKTENRLTCPHGRPTGWLLSTYEIERKFKRK